MCQKGTEIPYLCENVEILTSLQEVICVHMKTIIHFSFLKKKKDGVTLQKYPDHSCNSLKQRSLSGC